jgi:hypothetical protein
MVIRSTSKFDAPATELPLYVTNVSTQDVLIWAPISVSGLTTQLEQVTKILESLGINFRISFYQNPEINHALRSRWIDPIEIKNPKLVIFMERYFPFQVGFASSYHVFYLNLDWLRQDTLSLSRAYADEVMLPTTYRLEEFKQLYGASRVNYIPWPSAFEVIEASKPDVTNAPINVLYVGNDYDNASRKNPKAVCDAIAKTKNSNIILDLKFRSELPSHVKRKLNSNPRVRKVIDYPITRDEMTALYDAADINLIPNDSEGNGLSILESFARGVVPAVLAGHPMVDVAPDHLAFHIDCEEVGMKEYAPLYRTNSAALTKFFDSLSREDVIAKASNIPAMQIELRRREEALADYLKSVALKVGVLNKAADSNVKGWWIDRGTAERPPSDILIDVYLTTSRRPQMLKQSLSALAASIKASPYQHKLTVLVDQGDVETEALLADWRDLIDQQLISRSQMGLPYSWNMVLDTSMNATARLQQPADYLCYIQDDCCITDPVSYFKNMVDIAESVDPSLLGIVSGFHTEVHPGFERTFHNGSEVIVSRSVDGKNLFARPKTLYRIGKLSWWFDDGEPRGNPGPLRGSHFDLWQWSESPNALSKQGRYCFIVPGLCHHIAQTPEESTWENDTTDENTHRRISRSQFYR